ncbi:MAG: hypothetical protein J6Q22_09385 [Prevotella sp.]|nr:hypothetical protein [Prevotella sp.]
MAGETDEAENERIKYRFVEEFPESIDPETGMPYEDIESPKLVKTELWGEVELHRIAKVKWTEVSYVQQFGTTDSKGQYSEEEREIKVYEEEMGEPGGWIEKKENLDQKGKCWVEKDAVVLGNAHVYGDAVVKAGAEIGDNAKVGGEAEVSGPVGIGEDATVLGKARIDGDREELEEDVDEDWKKGMKRKRIAVGGNAVVSGEVTGTSKAYGYATVGGNAKMSGKAKVYGSAYVDGTEDEPAVVSDEAEVYGFARINGTVKDKAVARGNAHVGVGGKIGDSINLRNGEVFGEISGIFSFFGLYLFVGEKAKIRCVKEEDVGKTFFSDDVDSKYAWSRGTDGNTDVIYIGDGCELSYCLLSGMVRIENTKAEFSGFYDSTVKDSKIYGSTIKISRIADADLYLCSLTDTQTIGGCKLKESKVTHGIIPKGADWDHVTFGGVTDVLETKGTSLSPVTKQDMDSEPLDNPYQDPRYEDNIEKGVVGLDMLGKVTDSETGEVRDGTPYTRWISGIWSRANREIYRKNYSEYRKAIVAAIRDAPNYDPRKDPPMYVLTNLTGRALYEYNEAYYDRYLKWWKENTEQGRRQAKAEERYQLIRNLLEPLYDEDSALRKDEWMDSVHRRLGVIGALIGWKDPGTLLYSALLDDSTWEREYNLYKQSIGASSGKTVNITAPYEMQFVVNKTKVQNYYIPDFKSEVDVSYAADGWGPTHRYTKEDGIHIGDMTKGEWLYRQYSSYSLIGGMNGLVQLMEYYDGELSMQKNQKKVEVINTAAIDEKIQSLAGRIDMLESWVQVSDSDGYYAILPEDEAEYNSLASQLKAARQEYDNLVGVKEEEQKYKERQEKRKADQEIEQEYQKRWKKILDQRNYVSKRKAAIRNVATELSGVYFTSAASVGQSVAAELRDILQTLMYGSPTSDGIDQLLKQAAAAGKRYSESGTATSA